MASRSPKNQDELMGPVNGYQLQALSEKIDGLSKSQEELKTLILSQAQTYPTRTELALELEKRDNDIKAIKGTLSNYSRVVWVIVSAFVPMVALTIWQLIINSSGGRS